MALAEIEFELPALQFELMGYPRLQQGQFLTVQLDLGVLLPDPAADGWFAVQKEPILRRIVQVGRNTYAMSGQIQEADLVKQDGLETAAVLIDSDIGPIRATCAPQSDGRLPEGTWETRYLTAYGHLQGIVEEDFASSVGRQVSVTLWAFRRLVLTPGDPKFGEWHETHELAPSPYVYDRVVVRGHIHADVQKQ